MKRTLVVLLVLIVAAGWLGTLIAEDPGYVLITYGDHTVQTGLWVFLALLLTLVTSGYYVIGGIKWLLGTGSILQRWRAGLKHTKSIQLTDKGMVFLQQGAWERAEKFLVAGAIHSPTPSQNYISAAKAADAQNHIENRERYFRLALEVSPKAEGAVALARAETNLARGEWRKTLVNLEQAGQNKITLGLRKQALLQLRDWQGLADVMPELRKHADDEASQLMFEKQVARQRLASPNNTDESLEIIYNRLPEVLRRDPEIVLDYCQYVRDDKQTEAVIRSTIKHHWDDQLAVMYGQSAKAMLTKRIKTAEGWQKNHPDNWALNACLGQLYEGNGEKDRAKVAYNKSLQMQPSVLAHERLAKLLAFDGEYAKSSDHLRQALKITQSSHQPSHHRQN